MQVAFNNPWIKAVTGIEEQIKEDFLPVNVRKAVTDGNIWDNLASIDFWATEGADGLGYIVSMMAPGALLSKAGLGTKLLSPIAKFDKMGKAASKAATKLTKFGITPKNIDLLTITTANTLFEAGAEAKGRTVCQLQGRKAQRTGPRRQGAGESQGEHR